MSQWLMERYMAVDPSAFCAFGIQKREAVTAIFYDLWGVTRGGSRSVLATYGNTDQAEKNFARLVRMATGVD